VSIESVKKYLNITTNDFDTFIEEITGQVLSEFDFLFQRNCKVFASLQYDNSFFGYNCVSYLRPLPTIFQQIRVDGNEVFLYEFSPITGALRMVSYGKMVEITCQRGYQDFESLPDWTKLSLTKIIALEFKRSFQGDGALFFSGRTVGDVSFNFYQDLDKLIDIEKRKIRNLFLGISEIEERRI